MAERKRMGETRIESIERFLEVGLTDSDQVGKVEVVRASNLPYETRRPTNSS